MGMKGDSFIVYVKAEKESAIELKATITPSKYSEDILPDIQVNEKIDGSVTKGEIKSYVLYLMPTLAETLFANIRLVNVFGKAHIFLKDCNNLTAA